VAAFDARGTFVGETLEGFRRWLFGIADHKMADAVRRHEEAENRSIRREVADPDGEGMERIVAPEGTPSEIAMAGEMADLAGRARDSLPVDHQEVLRLVREHGLTFAETAERMGRTREAVKKLYGRAVVGFRRVFEQLRRGADA
jgi:RNA polymerase sigma factor (sigma-70 family)